MLETKQGNIFLEEFDVLYIQSKEEINDYYIDVYGSVLNNGRYSYGDRLMLQDLLNLSGKIASTGFSDTSRVGGGNPALGIDLAKNNTSNILNSINHFKKNISEIEKIIEDSDWDLLEEKLKKTQEWRNHFC